MQRAVADHCGARDPQARDVVAAEGSEAGGELGGLEVGPVPVRRLALLVVVVPAAAERRDAGWVLSLLCILSCPPRKTGFPEIAAQVRDVGKRVFDDKSKLVISATLRNNADDAQSRNSAASMLSAGFVQQ